MTSWLLTLVVCGRRHATENLPCIMSANPCVGNAQHIRPDFAVVVPSPGGFDSVMVDCGVPGYMNGELLDRVGLQSHAFRCVRRDPICDVIFPEGR